MELCGACPRGPDNSEIILNPQPDKACTLGDKAMRVDPFEDLRGDGGMVLAMVPLGAPFKFGT